MSDFKRIGAMENGAQICLENEWDYPVEYYFITDKKYDEDRILLEDDFSVFLRENLQRVAVTDNVDSKLLIFCVFALLILLFLNLKVLLAYYYF